MISQEMLAGYLLEEVLASLMQSAGYRLLTHCSQDPADLRRGRSGDLQVRGRGADHQVDVLGEFTVIPAFSHPLRLFVEAKARGGRVRLPVIRNAVGTINDINDAWMVNYSENRARRQYRYALFSTSGFSEPAQKYAIAHQISIIDLSGPEWARLRGAVNDSARELLRNVPPWLEQYPVRVLRQVLRGVLGTAPEGESLGPDTEAMAADLGLRPAAHSVKQRLDHAVDGALLAFPAGPQVLLVRPDNLDAFLQMASEEPEHQVSLSVARDQSHDTATTWVVRPMSRDGGQYTLRLTLPSAVERRALAETDRRLQSLAAKGELGGRLDIFWDPHGSGPSRLRGPRLFRLIFSRRELRRRRVEDGSS
ncbi:restriction endonuclease [Micromonospora sp. ZYX-F-536]|uniref:restriction endonuclease n=1 Tax=Micromonospora sp. ZYX-F-536 TaxID=3457629 RepID=UPI004040BABD